MGQAYLNLEGSGRELESIVVGEIQKAYNVYAGLLTKEADEAYETVEKLKSGPIAMPKDQEWSQFVESDKQFINPKLPIRSVEAITYPGKNDPAAAEVRSGMLERKSKYLKSYTAGWYVISKSSLIALLNLHQVCAVAHAPPRVQIGRSTQQSSARHVSSLTRAKARLACTAWFDVSQIHGERTPDRFNAPRPFLGISCRIP